MLVGKVGGGSTMKPSGQLCCAIEAMRCYQWVKNLFVFAAPVFAKQLAVPSKMVAAGAAFAAFCLASSAVYLFNDLVDLEHDRIHPLKKGRPLASGRLSVQYARTVMILLALGALSISLAVSRLVTGIIAVYIVMQVFYSLILKDVVILDVLLIATGFILRILAGAAAVLAAPSYWLLLCTLNVSLFLGFAKRRAELVTLEDDASKHRKVLDHYSQTFLDQMISIVTGTTLICYILYTVDARTVTFFDTHLLVATVPFVMYGLFRYLYLSHHKCEGGNPTKAVLMDLPFLSNIACWGLACIAIIYWCPKFPSGLSW
jgi:4-hydroxybenzoate polyprenyltransferase